MSRSEVARRFLEEAKQELEECRRTGDEVKLRQASEKAWGAMAQALMHAAGRKVTRHAEYPSIATELFKRTGRREILEGFAAADALHAAGFYHGLLFPETIETSIQLVERAIRIIEQTL